MNGWHLKDRAGHTEKLKVKLAGGEKTTVTWSGASVRLNDHGDMIYLINAEGVVLHITSYSEADVVDDVQLTYDNTYHTWGNAPTGTKVQSEEQERTPDTIVTNEEAKEAHVYISELVASQNVSEGMQSITVRNRKSEDNHMDVVGLRLPLHKITAMLNVVSGNSADHCFSR